MCCRQFARCLAEHRERSDGNRLSTALLQRDKRAANRRTGVDDVVNDRDAFAPKLRLQRLWDRI